jgi:diguanylate cyclase (GGDEF)-like protein
MRIWGGLAVLSALVLFRQIMIRRGSDARTGLGNRGRFRAATHRALTRGGRHCAVLVLDLNGFREVNDTLGHQAGDRVLIEFASLLRRCVPRPGVPCRLGADEFGVVLPAVSSAEAAYEIAGRIAASVGPVVVSGGLVAVAAAIGVAVSAPGELTCDEIVHRAEVARCRAKKLAPQTRWAAWQASFERPLPVAA